MGKIFKILLLVFLVILLAAGVAGIYFYNYYVFKTMRVCVSNESKDIQLNCTSDLDCRTKILENNTKFEEMIANAPVFMQDKMREIFDKSIFCEETCRIKSVYGDGFGKSIDGCNTGDEEILIEIHGKEGVEALKFAKENSGKS